MQPLLIAFYKDGITLEGYPFRPYHSKEAQSILSDILDGFFPYDLKIKFPEGVPLKIVDHTIEMHQNVKEVKKEQIIFDQKLVEEKRLQPLSKEEFLKQLPDNVIKDGKIVPIKEGIASKFGIEKTQETVELQSPACNLNETFCLRIRTENGKPLLLIKTSSNESISNIYSLCSKYR